MDLLHSQDNIDIYYNPDGPWLYVDWKGYQTEGFVQQGCERMLQAMVSCGVSKVLNDNTNVVGIWIGAAEWGATDWFPRMRQNGLKHFAWVNSTSRLSQISTDATLSMAATDTATVFNSVPEAEAWLKAQQ